MPSTPSKPSDVEATPIDWPLIARPVPRETVSVNSVPVRYAVSVRQLMTRKSTGTLPEKEPEPYVTD
jgi:hypothetical protein